MSVAAPLRFAPIYRTAVWGGRRLLRWRPELPAGPVGEAWELADHPNGQSRVVEGPERGATLGELVLRHGAALVGAGFRGGVFPLMTKLIDATERLSVQVHPDDALARTLGVGENGKTECWFFLAGGGEVFQGTKPKIDAAAFERALAAGTVAGALNRFEVTAGDFYFVPARTVHALGSGCLLYEVQQTSDVTFRAHDWGRVGLDGQPRPLHVKEAMRAIDFTRTGFGPTRPGWTALPGGGERRLLVECPYFSVEERRGAGRLTADVGDACAIVFLAEGGGIITTSGGEAAMPPLATALVPAAAGAWTVEGPGALRVLIAQPRFG